MRERSPTEKNGNRQPPPAPAPAVIRHPDPPSLHGRLRILRHQHVRGLYVLMHSPNSCTQCRPTRIGSPSSPRGLLLKMPSIGFFIGLVLCCFGSQPRRLPMLRGLVKLVGKILTRVGFGEPVFHACSPIAKRLTWYAARVVDSQMPGLLSSRRGPCGRSRFPICASRSAFPLHLLPSRPVWTKRRLYGPAPVLNRRPVCFGPRH
jgi:hypothetical protein